MTEPEKIIDLEKEAHDHIAKGELEEAQHLLKRAARYHAMADNHRQSALMYASAAGIWGEVYGDKSHYASAKLYEAGAEQAEKCGDFDYAAMLFKCAAINYERDGEFEKYSDCFYYSKDARRRHLLHSARTRKKGALPARLRYVVRYVAMSFSSFVWGYGERPFRTLLMGFSVILASAFGYMQGGIIQKGTLLDPSFFEALYFSVATITTLGYGDIAPSGLSRPVAMAEAICGIFIMPLFIVGLSRKYLRI